VTETEVDSFRASVFVLNVLHKVIETLKENLIFVFQFEMNKSVTSEFRSNYDTEISSKLRLPQRVSTDIWTCSVVHVSANYCTASSQKLLISNTQKL